MTRIDMRNAQLPTAPSCPSWCDGHSNAERNGWDTIDLNDAVKGCYGGLEQIKPHSGSAIDVVVKRYADIAHDAVTDEPLMTVRIDAPLIELNDFDLTLEQAETLAARLLEAVRLARP